MASAALLAAAPFTAASAEAQPATPVITGAVSAFSPRDLEVAGATDILGVAGLVPGMVSGNVPGLGSANTLYLRGLGTSQTLPGTDPAVAVLVDGVALPGVNGNNFGLFDVERVDVARGPQGARFGRNALGGAISVQLRQPGDKVGGVLEAGWGSNDRWQLRGSVDIPLAAIAAIKVSAYLQDDHGYARNPITGQDLNDGDKAGLRLGLRLSPIEAVNWNVAVAYMESNGENLLSFRCDPANPSNCDERTISTGMVTDRLRGGVPQYSLPLSGRKANFALGNEQSTLLVTSNLEWGGEAMRLNLITGFVDQEELSALDFGDGRGLPSIANPNPIVRGFTDGGRTTLTDGAHSQFSQEVRLSGRTGMFQYAVGALYLDQDSSADIADLETLENGTATGVPVLLADRILRSSTTAKSGYAEVSAEPIAGLTASAAVRYTDEEKRFSVSSNGANCAVPGALNCLAGIADQTVRAKQWTPRFAIGFAATEGVHLYASASRGYRAGGWNADALTRDAFLTADATTAWSYEAGVQSQWLDGRLRLNLTGFLMNADAVQAPMAQENALTGAVSAVTGNAADFRNHGVELEVVANPLSGLTLGANFTWQDARYSISDDAGLQANGLKTVRKQQQDCAADLAAGLLPLAPGAWRAQNCALGLVTADGSLARPVYAPDWTLALNAKWDIPVNWSGIIVSPAASLVYRSEMETDFANATFRSGASAPAFDGTVFPANATSGDILSGSAAKSVWLLNAAIEVRTDDENWRLALRCDNCLDKSATTASLYGYSYLNPPRTLMLSARRRF